MIDGVRSLINTLLRDSKAIKYWASCSILNLTDLITIALLSQSVEVRK